MTKTLTIALAQMNLTVGDISGNRRRIAQLAHRARDELGCGLAVFPELSLTGYPPEDLLLRPAFLDAADTALMELAREVEGIALLVGHPRRVGSALYNAASLLQDGRVVASYHKRHLPNYSVFDEKRYFCAGSQPCVVELDGCRLGLTVCEDVWQPGPVEESAAAGADLVININASPFHMDRARERLAVVAERARTAAVPVVYLNLVGGQDELVFDGASFVVDAEGSLTLRAPHCREALLCSEFESAGRWRPRAAEIVAEEGPEASVYQAILCGVRDYVEKNGFGGAIVGLSGGIDSALTLAIAADALGPERVEAVTCRPATPLR